MWVASHDFHRGLAAGTLSDMSPKSATRVLFLPVLLLLIGATSCHRDHRGVGTIRILVTSAKGLGIEHCRKSVDPNEIWKTTPSVMRTRPKWPA